MRVLSGRSAAALSISLTLAGAAAAVLSPVALRPVVPGPVALAPAEAATMSVPDPPGVPVASVSPATAAVGGAVRFTMSCATLTAAAAELLGQPLGLPALVPLNAAADEGDFARTISVPAGARPGSYRPRIDCSDGSSAVTQLRLLSVRAAAQARAAAASRRAAAAAADAPVTPAGAGLAAGGIALMAVGAVAGGSALALRRRTRVPF